MQKVSVFDWFYWGYGRKWGVLTEKNLRWNTLRFLYPSGCRFREAGLRWSS